MKRFLTICVVATMLMCLSAAQAVIQDVSTLPPGTGAYVSSAAYHACYPQGPQMSDLYHYGFTNVVQTPIGSDELETFDSLLDAVVTIDGNPFSVTLTGPVTTMMYSYSSGWMGTFATEIVSMSLTGNVGGLSIEIRENPDLSSLGQTTITDLGGGLYDIDSFFDVFTELSVDGGAFMADTCAPARMTLTIPEPATICLLGLGGLLLRRRKHA